MRHISCQMLYPHRGFINGQLDIIWLSSVKLHILFNSVFKSSFRAICRKAFRKISKPMVYVWLLVVSTCYTENLMVTKA